ncbi:hypothetical protein [Priestia abyssalis]|nr:hypothetical protein [Priestia abyssalis]
MMWLRFVPLAFFSITALSLAVFQSIEITQAFIDMFFHRES